MDSRFTTPDDGISAEVSEALAPEKQLKHVVTELGLSVPVALAVIKRGHYTSHDFRRLNPAKHAACLELLAQRWSKEAVRLELGVAWETVDAVARDPESSAEIREISGRLLKLGQTIVERSLELHAIKLQEPDAKPLTVFDTKLVFDMTQVLQGAPTSIHEERHVVRVEAFNEYLDSLPDAMPQTGLVAGDLAALGCPVLGGDVEQSARPGGEQGPGEPLNVNDL